MANLSRANIIMAIVCMANVNQANITIAIVTMANDTYGKCISRNMY